MRRALRTHTYAQHIPPEQLLPLLRGDVMCVWIFIAQCMYPLFVCSCACMHVCLLCMRICGVCVCVRLLVWANYVAEEFPFDLIPASLIHME